MSRRPFVDIMQASLIVPRGEAGFWSVILKLDAAGTWTVREVCNRTNVDVTQVARFVRKLRLGGFAEAVETVNNGLNGGNIPGAIVYRLLKKPLLAPRLRPDGTELPETANEQLWRAIKMTKMFRVTDLVGVCPDVSETAARQYLYALAAAGVLSHTGHVFRLLRNLGSQAPKILATKLVFDPNSGTVVGSSVTREVSR